MNEDQEEDDIQKSMDKAFERIMYGVDKIGSFSTVVFDDQLVMVAILKMGGWEKVCSLGVRKMIKLQSVFEREYKNAIINPPRKMPTKLAGLRESVCSKFTPIYLGDISICDAIYRGEM